jgi:hypothetical protein
MVGVKQLQLFYSAIAGYPFNKGQNVCVDVAVGWANGSIVNPTSMPSSVGCEKHAAQRNEIGNVGLRYR